MKYVTEPPMVVPSAGSTTVSVLPRYNSHQQSYICLVFQDGKYRSVEGTKVIDLTAEGELGVDLTPISVSTAYYIYAVPLLSDDGEITYIASAFGPGVGPSGYSNFRYVGKAPIDGSGNVIPEYQDGSYKFRNRINDQVQIHKNLWDAGQKAWALLEPSASITYNTPPAWSTLWQIHHVLLPLDTTISNRAGSCWLRWADSVWGNGTHIESMMGSGSITFSKSGSNITVTGFPGGSFSSNSLGRLITFELTASGTNNGTFPIAQVNSDTSIVITNAGGGNSTTGARWYSGMNSRLFRAIAAFSAATSTAENDISSSSTWLAKFESDTVLGTLSSNHAPATSIQTVFTLDNVNTLNLIAYHDDLIET
jgi:hypothetical protein